MLWCSKLIDIAKTCALMLQDKKHLNKGFNQGKAVTFVLLYWQMNYENSQ